MLSGQLYLSLLSRRQYDCVLLIRMLFVELYVLLLRGRHYDCVLLMIMLLGACLQACVTMHLCMCSPHTALQCRLSVFLVLTDCFPKVFMSGLHALQTAQEITVTLNLEEGSG